MLYEDFLSDFNLSLENNDLISANNALMKELGNILIRKKQDFVDLLNESGVPASINDSDLSLVESFVNNVGSNRKLMLGASLLTQINNKQIGFDGEFELSDDGVKNGYNVMRNYFLDEQYSNAVDAATIGAIAQGVGALAGTASTAIQGRQRQKFGGQEIAQKREESKQQMIQSILAQKQLKLEAAKKQEEEKAKTKRLIYIIGGSVLGLAILGLVIYSIKKK
jgi:hypothetical protein